MEIKESESKGIWILTLNGVMMRTLHQTLNKLEAGIASGKPKSL